MFTNERTFVSLCMVQGEYDSLGDSMDHLGKIQALEMMSVIMGDTVDSISLDLQTNIASSSHYIMEKSAIRL